MEEDRLRIPSTKRICFIGRTKSHGPETRDKALAEITRLVGRHTTTLQPRNLKGTKDDKSIVGHGDQNSAKRRKLSEDGGDDDDQRKLFVPRDKEIKVRNCTQIDQVSRYSLSSLLGL